MPDRLGRDGRRLPGRRHQAGRKIALKVLPAELAESEERRARFQREAKAIAALDHPNIVQVSVEEADGTHFITMQLVQAKTLTELPTKSGFPPNTPFPLLTRLPPPTSQASRTATSSRGT